MTAYDDKDIEKIAKKFVVIFPNVFKSLYPKLDCKASFVVKPLNDVSSINDLKEKDYTWYITLSFYYTDKLAAFSYIMYDIELYHFLHELSEKNLFDYIVKVVTLAYKEAGYDLKPAS